MKPSIGRIVHLAKGGGVCTPAIVVSTMGDNYVYVTEFTTSGPVALSTPLTQNEDDEQKLRGYGWHWPERVD